MPDLSDRLRGCLLGLAVGDALGTAVEFSPRGSFKPLADMTGGGPFHLQPGQWTDDTSMALCLAASLVECQGFDPRDQMQRYWDWYQNGYLSSTGKCFDIGNTVRGALHKFNQTGDPFSGSADPHTAGNGSIMRLAPIVIAYYPDPERIGHYAAESSRTTHAAPECLDACRLLSDILYRLLSGADKEPALLGTDPTRPSPSQAHWAWSDGARLASPSIEALARGDYRAKNIDQIRGAGYVVESLEAALWCFWKNISFESAVLQAANLGDDADTTAAVCGQLAGAFYSASAIPAPWLEKLAMREEITALADRLAEMDL